MNKQLFFRKSRVRAAFFIVLALGLAACPSSTGSEPVSPEPDSGTPITPIRPGPGTPANNLTITVGFTQGAITITGSDGANVISKTGSPNSLTFSVDSTAGYTVVAWYVDGDTSSGTTTDSLTINASAYDAQKHSVTFTGTKDGVFYSSEPIPFTVKN
ncbi:MAG: hypothetical protein LBG14_00075 [Treponema sp.]|jgi:hypothetical protein|nr:hypothetical protein [Treponema sp.]